MCRSELPGHSPHVEHRGLPELPLTHLPDVILSPLCCFRHVLQEAAPDAAQVLQTLTDSIRRSMADALESCPPCIRAMKMRDDGYGWRCCGACCCCHARDPVE